MQRVFVLIGLLICFQLAKAGGELSCIQAICKITLNNGQQKEGIITFIGGGIFHYRPNGFCMKFKDGAYGFYLFFENPSFAPESIGSYKNGEAKLYFVKNVSVDSPRTSNISMIDSSKILTEDFSYSNRYKLKDSIVIYLSLPLTLDVEYPGDEKIDYTVIAVSKIKNFEIVSTPSEYWLNLITKARLKTKSKMQKDELKGSYWVDYTEPQWYHEILKDKKFNINYNCLFVK
jgi:hypothetical protein